MSDSPAQLLQVWIGRQAAPEAVAWTDQKYSEIIRDPSNRALGVAMSMVPRKIGKADLLLSAEDYAAADRARRGWEPVGWTLDIAARVLLLLGAARGSLPFADRLKALASTSDVGELISIYRGLPLYPDQPSLRAFAAEGLRTAMRSVFEAVAHHNPFPAEQFAESAWNHMVLKALFIETTLGPIRGLDHRWNPELARILCDYAHERWAASRPVSPELWRGVGRFAEESDLDDLARVLKTGSVAEKMAAALALSESERPAAARLLAAEPALVVSIESGSLKWANVQSEALASAKAKLLEER
jgi:hypothetical protein